MAASMQTFISQASQIPVMDTIHMKLPQQNTSISTLTVGDIKRQKFKLEPIKVLEPSSKKLSIPESQRIMYILEELVHKIEILDYINLIINSEERMKNIIKNHLTEEEKKTKFDQIFLHMCKYHRELINKYNRGEFSQEDGSERAVNQTKESLELMIKNSTKDILRFFNTKPALFETIKNELNEAKSSNPQLTELLGLFTEVRDMMHERLLTTPSEQKEKIEYVKELLVREKTNNELIKRLKEELNQGLANKEKEIQTRNDQIRRLEHELKKIESFGTETVKRTKTESEQQEASELKASDGRKAKLQQELNQLRAQFQTIAIEHRDQEQQLRKEKYKHETNVEGLVRVYDEDMGKKQEEFDEITQMYEEEKTQLSELEEKFKPLEEEYLKIMEEKRMLELMRQLEEETLNKKIKAAVCIQSFWRGFKIRKGLFKKKKGKGKGKKGKK